MNTEKLKAAAERANAALVDYEGGVIDAAEFHRLAAEFHSMTDSPDQALELIAALEAAEARILALLVEREADKKQISEQRDYIEALEKRLKQVVDHLTELESRTLRVELPPRASADKYVDEVFDNSDLAAVYNACRLECEVKIKNACAAAGITLETGGE